MISKKAVYRRRRITFLIITITLILFILLIIYSNISSAEESISQLNNTSSLNSAITTEPISYETTMAELPATYKLEYPSISQDVKTMDSLVDGEYAVLLDIKNNKIIAQKNGDAKIYPASLTKIMTIIVAIENIKNTDDTFTMRSDIIDPLINQQATRAGFSAGEKVKIVDMLYGAALPSGADATIGLAEYISGSEDEFVKLMNQKAEELGLKNTHFVNTSGLHDPNHYTTPTDLAVILEYAIENELCRQILSTYKYTTTPTPQHPQGIELESTMFSRMYGNEVPGVTIEGGKTGYTTEAGHCLASFAEKNGQEYIAVSTMSHGKYKPIYDSFEIFGKYIN